jgi:hypothetical protein
LWNQLEHWVDRFKKDIQDWGIGYGPIFTDGHGRWSNSGWQRAVGDGTMQQRSLFLSLIVVACLLSLRMQLWTSWILGEIVEGDEGCYSKVWIEVVMPIRPLIFYHITRIL